jgi:hypothetical protein
MRLYTLIISIVIFTNCKAQLLAVIKLNGKYGCIDKKGNLVIEPTWDYIFKSKSSKQILVEKDSLYGYIDKNGNILIKPQFKEANLFSEGLAAVSNGEKYGFINTSGEIIIPYFYDETFMGFNNGVSDVRLNDSCGYIDKNGKVVIPLIYETAYPFMSEYAQVETFSGKSLLINKKGKTFNYNQVDKSKRLWRPRNSYPGSFTTSTGQGRINVKGDTIVPPIYKVTGNLINHMFIVQDKKNKWGAVNEKGVLKVKCKFDEIWHFYEGVANFKLNNKWGFVSTNGQIIIKPTFEYASQFSNGLAYVELNGKAGFINKKGQFIIQPIYEPNRGSSFE